jgi:hypothetical protein
VVWKLKSFEEQVEKSWKFDPKGGEVSAKQKAEEASEEQAEHQYLK